MAILIMNEDINSQIAEAIRLARARMVPWDVGQHIVQSDTSTSASASALHLDQRKPGVKTIRDQYPPIAVMLGNYRANISFEQQPAGIIRHLSVSTPAKGKIPGHDIMTFCAEAFGFSGFPPTRPHRVWVEEYEPKKYAVNIAELEPGAEPMPPQGTA